MHILCILQKEKLKRKLYWSFCPYNLVLEHSQTKIYCQELSSIRTPLLLVKPNFVHYAIHILSMLVMFLHLLYKSSLCIPQWGTVSFLKLGFSFSFSCWTLSSMLNMQLFLNFSPKKKKNASVSYMYLKQPFSEYRAE